MIMLDAINKNQVGMDENTVYGVRSGAHQCLLVVSNDKHNVFLKSKAWKTGVIQGAAMLPRSEMLKVEKCQKGFASEARLTRVQELKQAGLVQKVHGRFPHLAHAPSHMGTNSQLSLYCQVPG